MNKDELKQYRERIGLNQGELSKALGVANNTVSRWELGQRSIPEFLPLALETIERRLSTVGSDSVSTVGSVDNKSTVGSVDNKSTVGRLSTVGSPESSKSELDESTKESFKERMGWKNSALDIVNSSSDNELLSTVQVAARLNVSRKSVNDYIIDGKLKATKGKQNHNFVTEADLQEFIKKS
jgi:DNA-binding XRE family transcriptional regulator